MRNTRIQKSPLNVEGSSVVYRRIILFGKNHVCKQGNFTRYATGKSKPEVQR